MTLSAPARSVFSRYVVPAAIVAASLAFALAACEGLLRLIGFSYPALHVPDDLTGLRLRAGAQGWYGEEGGAEVSVNPDGWRDRQRSKSKPPDVLRIAVLGDSFTEAVQVPLEATFPARLEQELDSCRPTGKRAVEVLNFGVSSYGTAQQLLTLRHRVSAYSPDIVMLAFLPSNDVRNNSRKLEGWKARPFFTLQAGELVLDASFRDDPGFREKKRQADERAFLFDLRLDQLFRKVRDGQYRGWNDAPAAAAVAKGQAATLREAGIAERAFVPPQEADWDEAWKITDRLIEALRNESRAIGAGFVVVVLTSGATVYPDKGVRERYAKALGVQDFFYPDRRISALGKHHGFRVIALGDGMQRRADERGVFFHGFPNTQMGFGHWNAEGHRAASGLIAAELCKHLGGGA